MHVIITKELYIFSPIFEDQNHFFLKILEIIVCLFVLVEGKNATTTEAPSTTSGPIDYDPQNISYCIRPQWVGDNECDPVCNTPWCNFDDGDCEGM